MSVREENAAGALEVMSRFALHPRCLPYLPPTMAPVATSRRPGYLEHPDEAFAWFADVAVPQVICEEKHMGSRAVALVCRDAATAAAAFGGDDGRTGALYTRTGRSFFPAAETEAFLARLRDAVDGAGLWDEFGSDWLLLDGELLPWSLKSDGLLRETYAATGAAARAALPPAIAALQAAAGRGLDVADLLCRTRERRAAAVRFTDAYRAYRWDVDGLDGVEFAPFQVLAARGATFETRPHSWHLDVADRLAAAAPGTIRRTARLVVDARDEASRAAGVAWWEDLTAVTDDQAGPRMGEGMVVKPLANLTRGAKGLVQPGLKVRGREYLRLIYGPDYLTPAHLERLRDRNLGPKRGLALREYALGMESLRRLVAGEPLWRVHEPVFGVLAMESEPVDPRL